MKSLSIVVSSGLLLLIAASQAPASNLKITNTTFGWNPFTDSVTTGGSTAESQYPAIAVNQELEVRFNTSLSPGSVTESTVLITSIGADELGPLGLTSSLPGGVVAPVTLKIKKNKLLIRPAYFFQGSSVNFGFAPLAYYRLELKGKRPGLRGRNGDTLRRRIFIQFRTTDQVADMRPGAPIPSVKVLDSVDGKTALTETSTAFPQPSYRNATPSPAPGILIKFNELVVPSSIVNPASGESTTLIILLDVDDNPATATDRIALPGKFAITHTSKRTLVEWTPAVMNVPDNSFYLVNIEPYVEDLVGNSRFTETMDSGAKQLFGYRTKDASGFPLDPIVEEFVDQLKLDALVSSADWNRPDGLGVLKNGPGGGTGEDGAYKPTSNDVLSTSIFDVDLGREVEKVWNFTSVDIPVGVTVSAAGEFPLQIRSTGAVNVFGTIDVSGAAGEQFSEVRVRPGAGGVRALGGGGGAVGGSVSDGIDLDTGLFGLSTVAGYALPTAPNQGLSTLSSTPLTDFTLISAGGFPMSERFAGLWLQPNVGTGSFVASASPGDEIKHNHATFMIESVSLAGTGSFNVISDSLNPLYFGSLIQPSLDTYEFPPPPIAKPGDPFQVGDMAGHVGDAVGLIGSGGLGSLPMTVAQEFLTLVRSGGGGGGGGRTAGDAGEDSPTAYGGSSTGTAGASGGAGALTGAVSSMTATVLTASGSPFMGLDLNGDSEIPPFIVYPNTESSYHFEIASNTDSTLTIVPLELSRVSAADTDDSGVIDLDDLLLGSFFRVEASLERGGSGGGSSGVHLANTSKFPGPPNQTLPTWTPGAGGGAGAGSVVIESARQVVVGSSGRILAVGGEGGRTTGAISRSASGGGAGAGGTVLLASADPGLTAVKVLGLVDANGGGGGIGEVDGGAGGAGRARFEALNGNLVPGSFSETNVTPAILATDLGFFIPGQSPTLGQSRFYNSNSFPTSYTDFMVVYQAEINDVVTTGLTYTRADLLAGNEAPFELFFNDADVSSSGNVDQDTVDEVFVNDPASLSGGFVRFRIALRPAATIKGDVYRKVKIDSLTIDLGL